ncbi:hypothetical protein V1277_004955 [Bradyrhizobium sp. AZCC 1588]
MSSLKEVWPLAFVLATASSSVHADAPIDTNPAEFFRSGSLADTLRSYPDASGGTESSAEPSRIQLSQWANFFNCFSGVWRRC